MFPDLATFPITIAVRGSVITGAATAPSIGKRDYVCRVNETIGTAGDATIEVFCSAMAVNSAEDRPPERSVRFRPQPGQRHVSLHGLSDERRTRRRDHVVADFGATCRGTRSRRKAQLRRRISCGHPDRHVLGSGDFSDHHLGPRLRDHGAAAAHRSARAITYAAPMGRSARATKPRWSCSARRCRSTR